MVSWPKIVLIGIVMTRRSQAVFVLPTLPDLPGNAVVDHPVSSLVANFTLSESNELAVELQPSPHSCCSDSWRSDRKCTCPHDVYLTIFAGIDDGCSENPFNYDLNDLDLDGFCLMLQRDLHEITAVNPSFGWRLLLLILTLPPAPWSSRSR